MTTYPLLLVFATLVEAKPTLKALGAKKQSHHLYQFENGKLLICGMGSISAASSLTHYINISENIHSFGIAGAFNKDLKMGDFCHIKTVDKHLHLPENLDSHSQHFAKKIHPCFSNLEGSYRLITSDYPIHNKKDNALLSKNYDLVDMEGYGLAWACQREGKTIQITKIVSDFANSEGPDLIRKQIATLSEGISQFILKKTLPSLKLA